MSPGGRDPALERQLLDKAIDLARREFGVDCRTYAAAVESRLELGAERYGDAAFLERDNLRELLEETPDVGGYALLEIQRLGLDDEHREACRDLIKAMMFAAAADFYAWRVAMRRDGGPS